MIGEASPYSYLPSGATNQDSQVVKAAAGQIFAMMCYNTNATAVYLKLYDQTTAPTSSNTPKMRLCLPGNANGSGFVIPFALGMTFNSGITFRVTGGLADADTTAVSSGVAINLVYE